MKSSTKVSSFGVVSLLAVACTDAPSTGRTTTIDVADGASGAGGSRASGGAVGTGGTIGTGGGTGGASGGNANAGGASGGGQIDETTFARAVVALGSCNGDDGPLRITTFLRGRQGGFTYPKVSLACLAAVTNGCEGIFDCWGMTLSADDAGAAKCDGNVAVRDGGRWDCSKVGATCRSGNCLPTGEQECTGSYVSNCDAEGRPNDCDKVVQKGPVCASFGLTCGVDSFDAYCVGTGTACTGSDVTYFDIAPKGTACNGNTLSACVGGKTADLDCAKLGDGFSCQTGQGVSFCGLANECDPLVFGTLCQGTAVVFCDAGKLRRVDCTSLGLSGCGSRPSEMCVP